MSRLVVDLGGGVMENAHVNLDRYGMPVIPGSAVKGCARRMALRALHDLVAAHAEHLEADYAGAPCSQAYRSPAEMLAAIAVVFGWVGKDWDEGKKDGLYRSDFGWACGEAHEAIWNEAACLIAARFELALPGWQPWKKLPSFAGSISFLPASPNTDPGLELDVVTPHHTKYYRGESETAVDSENPIPVYFPVVKAQREADNFVFPLIPLARAREDDIVSAKRWLGIGLEILGIGAKTNAGYGWFHNVTEEVEKKEAEQARLRRLEAEFSRFSGLPGDLKDEAILALADRPDDCRFWNERSRESFAALLEYALSQDISLL